MASQVYDVDELGSDDLGDVLEFSRQQYLENAVASGSGSQQGEGDLRRLDAEISEVKKQIADLQAYLTTKESQRRALSQKLANERSQARGIFSQANAPKGNQVNYATTTFPWTQGMKDRMKKVFKIDGFRLCQEGVCNANMDGRDIIVVMPTGGGKSLTYQLPALLASGCTVVISPLISLITDQVMHLREASVPAAMLMSQGSSGRTESQDAYRKFEAMVEPDADPSEDLKLCYVTPERIAKDTRFIKCLTNLYHADKFARIIVDEAHCVSEYGHDFRPDYKQLSKLRELFPRVPILALSATCPPPVLKDVRKILRLKELVAGYAAPPEGTVYFSSPLYRKNLHYKVVPKSSTAKAVINDIRSYILKEHANHSGIIYCFSRTESENVARELETASDGKIKTGVYHSSIAADEKEALHRRWRAGQVQVVCATIAFGLGIDKGDVRFVIHHSMSKSLDGYYQESGRAGRDGKDADCLLYYRPQDGFKVTGLTITDVTGKDRVHAMMKFAQDITECRKILIARHFSMSADIAIASWTTQDEDVLTRCGHCDNCVRDPHDVETQEVTMFSWRILKVVQEVYNLNGTVTLNQLLSIVRGKGKGKFKAATGKGKRKQKIEEEIDANVVAGGTVDMSIEDTERLCTYLLLDGYLKEKFEQNAYATNVYLVPGAHAQGLLRFPSEAIERRGTGGSAREYPFLREARGKKKARPARKKKDTVAEAESDVSDDPNEEQTARPPRKRKSSGALPQTDLSPSTDDDEYDGSVVGAEWGHTLRTPPRRSTRAGKSSETQVKRQKRAQPVDDVICISSD